MTLLDYYTDYYIETDCIITELTALVHDVRTMRAHVFEKVDVQQPHTVSNDLFPWLCAQYSVYDRLVWEMEKKIYELKKLSDKNPKYKIFETRTEGVGKK